ncbi:hypothetical protein FNL39_106254 [Nocardia caishijiensis]|uniref:Uncharacterized protein n=1 Tax=Nocardia caishijiensis TaxID=184756 RepID=A0ABQ6YJ89_9NOCA|nr:hypothetical protein FNL39_106254 [Nocardia caishijiensis]
MPDNESADPRARWRHLPPEPERLVEETVVDTSPSSLAELGMDPGEDSVRRYGG